MNKRRLLISWLAVLGAAVLVCSCGNKGGTAATGSSDTSGTTAGATGTTGSETKEYTAADVSPDLKKEAFEYYGLGSEKDLAVQLTQSDDKKVYTGSQEMRIKELKDGAVRYTYALVGDIGQVFSHTGEFELRPDGIYSVSVDGQPVDPYLELPNDLSPGKSWTAETKMPAATMSITRTIKGVEQVKTKAGEFEALHVSDKGVITAGTEKTPVTIENWYVKGRGAVKTVLTSKGAKPKTITIEVTE